MTPAGVDVAALQDVNDGRQVRQADTPNIMQVSDVRVAVSDTVGQPA